MECMKPIYLKEQKFFAPCGKCYPCLSNRRNQWTFRLKKEAQYSASAFFVTLTYNDENSDGHVHKEHIQLFIRKLREQSELTLKYYAVSEYGPQTLRPHYHVIIFIRQPIDIWEMRKYASKCWNVYEGISRGNIKVDPISQARLHYVTKYHITKPFQPKHLNKVFTLMSRKPAIGLDYVERMKSYHNLDNCYVDDKGSKSSMPRLFKDKLYSKEDRAYLFDVYKQKLEESDRQKSSDYWKKYNEFKLHHPELKGTKLRAYYLKHVDELHQRLKKQHLKITKQTKL